MKVAVIGAGAMGAAMALAFERAGNEVSICGTEFDVETLDAIRRDRVHPAIASFIPESVGLFPFDAWAEGLRDAGIAVVAVASVGLGETISKSMPFVDDKCIYAIASKGWDESGARPLSSVVAELAPSHGVVVLVGPTLAREIAEGTPTAFVCASDDRTLANLVADTLRSATVSTFASDDIAGVQVGSALKNVLAIGIGMCDGIAEAKGRPMTNTKAALFALGLEEMALLARALGGRIETVLGLAGAGDLFVTVLGGRNGRFGKLVGTGLDPRLALEEMGTTVEGFENAREAKDLAEREGLRLPIVDMVFSVLFEGRRPEQALQTLLNDRSAVRL